MRRSTATGQRSVRHKYMSEAGVKRILKQKGPLAAAVAECGGDLITVPRLVVRRVGRGCGSPTPALGTSSMVPCGAVVTDLSGLRTEYLCNYCEEALLEK